MRLGRNPVTQKKLDLPNIAAQNSFRIYRLICSYEIADS